MMQSSTTEKKISVALRDIEPVLMRVLEELMASDLERRPFVIVEDTVTERFVQFIRCFKPKTGELLFDVPALGVVLHPCPDPGTGAIWARATLAGNFGLPDGAALVIRIDGDLMN